MRPADAVGAGARPRGSGTGAGGRGGGALRGASPGGNRCPCPGRFPEMAFRPKPEQAEGDCRRGEGTPPNDEVHPHAAGRVGAAGASPFRSRHRVFRTQRYRVRAHGHSPIARNPDARYRRRSPPGLGSPGAPGNGQVAAQSDRSAQQASGGGAGEIGKHQRDRQGAVCGFASALQEAGHITRHRSQASHGVRRELPAAPCPGVERTRKGEVEAPDCEAPGGRSDAVEAAVRRGRSPAQRPEEVAAPEDHDQVPVQGERPAAQGREGGEDRPGVGERTACQASHGQENAVDIAGRHGRRAAQGSAPVAAPEEHDQDPVQGERPVTQNREGRAEPDRGAGSRDRETPCNREGAVEEALWAQERAAEETALGTQARPAARRARPRPHPAARARGAPRSTRPAAGGVHVRAMRAALRPERRRGIHPRRDRGQGPQARDPARALSPDLRVRILANRGVRTAGAAAVPRHALRNHLLGALSVRTLRLPAPGAPHRGMDVGSRAGGLAGDAGQQPEALRAAVRAAV